MAFAAGDAMADHVALRAAVSELVGPDAKIRSRSGAALALIEVESGSVVVVEP